MKMLLYETLLFLVLCLPGVVLSKIPIKFGAIMPEIMTFDLRSFNSAIFHTYLRARSDRRSNFYKYFDFERKGLRVAISHFSPQEILQAFCNEILGNDINAVIVVNNPYLLGRHQALEGYIFQLAGSLGLPVLSWNAQHSVADRVSEESLILEFAPSIDHQVQAILALLKQYDWPAFSILTTTLSGYKDFLNLLRQKTRTAKHWYDIDDRGTDIQRR